MRVLIVDDSQLDLKILRESLEVNGINVIEAKNGKECLEKLNKNFSDIGAITLDVEMPDYDGEVLAQNIRKIGKYKDIPIIFISSVADRTIIKRGLEIGAYDYILKPIDPYITALKVSNAVNYYKAILEIKEREENIIFMSEEVRINYKKIDELNRRLLEKNKILEVLVEARTKELQDMTNSLISALENANFYNDEVTGKHIERVALYSEVIARGANLHRDFVKEIKLYSPLHDIGKVGIPESVLKKPGKYTEEEFKIMKKHTEIGYNMIKDSPLSNVAKNIIKYHHEKWDGTGYGEQLRGGKIPIEARIVAIADVFDALATRRSYKEAFPLHKILEIMDEGRGRHFDPELVEVFFDNLEKMIFIKENNND